MVEATHKAKAGIHTYMCRAHARVVPHYPIFRTTRPTYSIVAQGDRGGRIKAQAECSNQCSRSVVEIWVRAREPDFRLRSDCCLCSWTRLDLGRRAKRTENGNDGEEGPGGRINEGTRSAKHTVRARCNTFVGTGSSPAARGDRSRNESFFFGEENVRGSATASRRPGGRSEPSIAGKPGREKANNRNGPRSAILDREASLLSGRGAGGTRRFSVSVRVGGSGRKATELRWLTVTGCGRICEERALGGPREKRNLRRGSIALTGPRGAPPHLSHRVVTVVVPTTALPWIP